MELKELLAALRRWAWLLMVGLLVGLIGGYLISYYMEPVYEASTKLMISRAIQEDNPDFAGLNSDQLVQTYVQLLKTQSLFDKASQRVGTVIDPKQVSVEQLPSTQIIELKVQEHKPEMAAQMANALIEVLIEQSEETQMGQYTASENRIGMQLEQLESQISGFQSEYDQAYENDYTRQLSVVEEQVNTIQAELSRLQVEIAGLKPEYNQEDRLLAAEKQAQIEQLQSVYVIYEQIRANLLVLGRPVEYSSAETSPRTQQLQSTLNLYQNLYLTLTEDLEKVRFERMQRAPTLFQIEKAAPPDIPVRPIPVLYTILSGIVGLMTAFGFAYLVTAWQSPSRASASGMVRYGSGPWRLEPPDVDDQPERPEAVQPASDTKLIDASAAANRRRRTDKVV